MRLLQLLLKLARPGLLLGAALLLKPQALFGQLAFGCAQMLAFGRCSGQLSVQFVQKPADIDLLRRHLRTRIRHDRRVESQTRGNIQPCRGAGHSQPQLIRRRQRHFVESNCRIEHALVLGRIHLQGSEVRRDDAPGAAFQKVLGDRDGKRRSFFRIGRRSQLIQQHQRPCDPRCGQFAPS